MTTHKKPSNNGEQLYNYVMWFTLSSEAMQDDLYDVDASCNIGQVVESEQRNVDQHAGTSINEVIGGDFIEQAEWPVVNGVVRRYGYSV